MKLYLTMDTPSYVKLISSGIYHSGLKDIITDVNDKSFNPEKYIMRKFQQNNDWNCDPIRCDVYASRQVFNDNENVLLTLDAPDEYVRLISDEEMFSITSLSIGPFRCADYISGWDYDGSIEDINPEDVLNRFTPTGLKPNEYEDVSDDCYVQLDRCYVAYIPFVKREWIVDCLFLDKYRSNPFNLIGSFYSKNSERPLLVSCRRDILNYCEEISIDIKDFNEPILISSYATDLTHLLEDCISFNQSVVFLPSEDGVKREINCGRMFKNCKNFNQDVELPDGVISCNEMFCGCEKFNSKVSIPNTVLCCYRMFRGCTSLDKVITTPESVNDYDEMFDNFDISSVMEISNESPCLPRLSEECFEWYPYIK